MKRAAEAGESSPTKRAAPALTLRACFDGKDVAVELPDDAARTSAQVCEAVAKAVNLPAVLLSMTHSGVALGDANLAELKKDAKVDVAVKADAELALLALKIQQAANSVGLGGEFVLQEGADDEEVDRVKENISLPPQVEMLLRVSNGVKTNGSVQFCSTVIPSTDNIMEIYGYNDVLTDAFDNHNEICVPWSSVDCEFAFEVLHCDGDRLTLWHVDHESRAEFCNGTLAEQFQKIHDHFALKKPGVELPQLRLNEKHSRFPFPGLRYEEVYE